tara:strand:- start:543 stop:992 length:450 start_codon:yes stop_codon:yes gene_type:complete
MDGKIMLYKNEDLMQGLKKIRKQIDKSNWIPEIIISINRGGCIPGVYLSHHLNLQHCVIDIQLRDTKKPPNIKVLEEKIQKFKNILLIDDINDSGKTLKIVYDLNNDSKTVYNATLIYNKESKIKTHFYGRMINRSEDKNWYVFPWEEW